MEDFKKERRQEYDDYIEELMKKSKKEIIEECYKTFFYRAIKDYFESTDIALKDTIFTNSLKKNKITISLLWDCYLKYDWVSVNTFADIIEFLEYVCHYDEDLY